jgi:hypothetical protein
VIFWIVFLTLVTLVDGFCIAALLYCLLRWALYDDDEDRW